MEATAMRQIGQVVRAVLVMGGALACVACSPIAYTATDGTHFEQKTTPDPLLPSLKASGAHDLPCTVESIKVNDLNGGDTITPASR
jgi:hypothetical protein